jgi:hypothetical protein
MNATTKLAALNRFRNTPTGLMRQSATKVLVVYDVQVKNPEVPHVPLIINYGQFLQIDFLVRFLPTFFQICRRPSRSMHIGAGHNILFYSLSNAFG